MNRFAFIKVRRDYVLGGALIACLLALVAVPAWAGAKLLGPNVRVDSNSGLTVERPAIAAASDTAVYTVWMDNRDVYDQTDIYFSRSTDGGAHWSANLSVSQQVDNELGLEYPEITVDPGGVIYVVWFNSSPPDGRASVYISRSDNGGASFETPWRLGYNNDATSFEPRITADPLDGRVYALISAGAGGGYTVYLTRSANQGTNWTTWKAINQSGTASGAGACFGPCMDVAARNGKVFVAWSDRRDGIMRIYGNRSTDQGTTWGTDFAISPASVAADSPRLALAPDGTLYAAYDTGDVYLRRSTDNGATWSTPVMVSQRGEVDLGPWDLAVDGNGTVAVVWGMGHYDAGFSDLYLATSINGGQSFTQLRVEDAPDNGGQYGAVIAAYGSGDNARAVLAWQDDRNAQDEIWSARAELDATPPTAPGSPRAVARDTAVDLSWTASTDKNGIAGYYVIAATTSGGPYTQVNSLPITQLSYRVVGLDATPRFYKIFAVDGTGNPGPASAEVTATAQVGTNISLQGVVAYGNGTQVRLRDLPALGNDRLLAAGGWPVFSADGQRVYYRDGINIYSSDLSGGSLVTELTNNNLRDGFDVAGDNPAYMAWVETKHYIQTNPFDQWDVFEPHFGPKPDSAYTGQYEFAATPSISRGRKWLAYTSVGNHKLHFDVYSYDHSALFMINLATNATAYFNENVNFQDPAFSPVGNWLAFAVEYSGQYEIWKAQVQTDGTLGQPVQLTRGGQGLWSRAPAWSPDGQWLVFHRDTDPTQGEDLQLFVVSADGSSLRPLNIAGMEPALYATGAPVQDKFVYLPLTRR